MGVNTKELSEKLSPLMEVLKLRYLASEDYSRSVHFDRFNLIQTMNPFKIMLELSETGRPIGHFSLSEMPGCCGIMISHNTQIYKDFQGKGIASIFQELKFALAKELGFSLLLCTVREDNEIEKHILQKFGWIRHEGSIFQNSRTTNIISVWTKIL